MMGLEVKPLTPEEKGRLAVHTTWSDPFNLLTMAGVAGISADAERYGIGLATAPIDNFITEFAPSIANRIHIHVVFVQRIVNQVARTGNTE